MIQSPIEIRAVGLEATELVAALHAGCFAASAAESWSIDSARSLLRMPGVLAVIAVEPPRFQGEQARPCGLAVARCGPDDAEILALGVLPQARRRAVATRLFDALLKRLAATQIRKILLEVAVDNQPARALYQANGFAEVGLRRGYYRRQPGPAIDALVLARSVDLVSVVPAG